MLWQSPGNNGALLYSVCYLDPSEGIVTPDMVAEQEASKGRVCRETDKLMGQASTTVALRQELQKINTMPMLTDKVRTAVCARVCERER